MHVADHSAQIFIGVEIPAVVYRFPPQISVRYFQTTHNSGVCCVATIVDG